MKTLITNITKNFNATINFAAFNKFFVLDQSPN